MVVATRNQAASALDESELDTLLDQALQRPTRHHFSTIFKVLATLALFLVLALIISLNSATDPGRLARGQSCDDVDDGYYCHPDISRYWGQYSPYFRVDSEIQDTLPDGCTVNKVNLLSRHGARDPTATRSAWYNHTVHKIQSSVDPSHLVGKYAFLQTYVYSLGADQLNDFGAQQLINSGTHFARRYPHLASSHLPFVRAASQQRVVDSAIKFTEGFLQETERSSQRRHGRKPQDPTIPAIPILILPEGPTQNNTLDHSRCTAFESGPPSHVAPAAKAAWAAHFVPAIQSRLRTDLPGAPLSRTDTLNLLSLCPFDTVAHPRGALSPFCALFAPPEFRQYNHYENLDKYYGYGAGNALGPTQGVGWASELLARLEERPVRDATSTNATLDGDAATFPLGRALYADFSHDNDLTSAMFALGLYDGMPALRTDGVDDEAALRGWGAARTVPFAGRMVVERMGCRRGQEGDADAEAARSEQWVRVLVNGRVVPVPACGGNEDRWGRCRLEDFVQGLEWVRKGGRWAECFDEQGESGLGGAS